MKLNLFKMDKNIDSYCNILDLYEPKVERGRFCINLKTDLREEKSEKEKKSFKKKEESFRKIFKIEKNMKKSISDSISKVKQQDYSELGSIKLECSEIFER